MPLPPRAIVTVTSAHAPLHGPDKITGLFIVEAMHPYNIFTEVGIEVDFVSEKGTYVPDWLSQQPDFLNGEDLKQWEDTNGEFRKKLDNMYKPSEIDPSRYGIFFASAGHAALMDYPTATGLHKIGSQIWANGGILSSVCHGAAIFAGINDPATDKPVVEGKTITGFTTQAEYDMGIMEALRTWNAPMIDEHAAKLGAKYTRPKGVWDSFHVTDGRLITGTNPASSKETATAVLGVYRAL
ncbi:class I glutamine amidotransferase-like protein [Periconia macrospinosa]|uniref:D-lactate dehydratase n=1 Tax=Periconia macrospinosa TaxID=97972 RepID=A0A2V1D7V2_9PLEO|nr:class I glutamine amidotransferase-like protein [Periconia macrospinosa]